MELYGNRKKKKKDEGTAKAETKPSEKSRQKKALRRALTLLGVIPQDEMVYRYDCDGKALVELPEDAPVKKALYEILERMGL